MVEFAGTVEVAGFECNIIKTKNQFGADVWWYFGKKDHLPHAQKWVNSQPGQEGTFMFEIHNLKTDVSLSEQDFSLNAPRKYTILNDDEREIKVGQRAPDFELQTFEGKEFSLLDLKGQIVILDFWASWCPPCWQVMPVMDSLAFEYRDKPVQIVGINTWEGSTVNPIEYVKTKKFSYTQLLHGEDVVGDYKIATLPAVFVIGFDGRFAYIKVGYGPKSIQELRETLKKMLADTN